MEISQNCVAFSEYMNFNTISITDETISELMKTGNDIRHTLFGAFSPTQNVTHKLRTGLERVRYESLFPILLHISKSLKIGWGSLSLKPNYFKKQCSSSSFLFT